MDCRGKRVNDGVACLVESIGNLRILGIVQAKNNWSVSGEQNREDFEVLKGSVLMIVVDSFVDIRTPAMWVALVSLLGFWIKRKMR